MIKFVKQPDKENPFDRAKVIYKTDAETLEDLIQEFQNFLKACGYHFDGKLEVVYEEE